MNGPSRSPHQRPRRSPAPSERLRDAERTKARILEAAADELSENGLAALRVAAIADRAGVNKQLISYYFGGKDGLLRALGEQWRVQKRAFDDPERPIAEIVADYAMTAISNPTGMRLLGWEGLAYRTGKEDPDMPARAEQAQRDLADLRRRQELGELAADLDPECVFLAVVAAGVAPVLLPHIAYSLTGVDPTSTEFVTRYAEQLARMVRHLAAR
jgi:TetR/AcrR family transcriptional regulator